MVNISTLPLEDQPELLRNLYIVAGEMLRLRPWEIVDESFIVGIENFRTKEIFYAHITGIMDEHRSISLYRESRGLLLLLSLFELEGREDIDPFRVLLECDKLELSFEKKAKLAPYDKELLDLAGFSGEKRADLPLFRAYRPGFFPWFIRTDEAEFLNTALNFLFRIIADMVEHDLPIASVFSEGKVSVFHITHKGTRLEMRKKEHRLPKVEREKMNSPALDAVRLRKIARNYGHANATWIMGGGYYSQEAVTSEEYEAPFYPFVVMYVDEASGFVLHHELAACPDIPDRVVEGFLATIERSGLIPARVLTPHHQFREILSPLEKALSFHCDIKEEIPVLNELMESMQAQTHAASTRGRRGKPAPTSGKAKKRRK